MRFPEVLLTLFVCSSKTIYILGKKIFVTKKYNLFITKNTTCFWLGFLKQFPLVIIFPTFMNLIPWIVKKETKFFPKVNVSYHQGLFDISLCCTIVYEFLQSNFAVMINIHSFKNSVDMSLADFAANSSIIAHQFMDRICNLIVIEWNKGNQLNFRKKSILPSTFLPYWWLHHCQYHKKWKPKRSCLGLYLCWL